MTPFQALYGYEPIKWKYFITKQASIASINGHLEENQKFFQILKENLSPTWNRMRQQVDRHRTEQEFEVGDWVFVRLQPYKHPSLKQSGENKLAPRFYGPYQINKKISRVAYALKLLATSRIHNVFHVSCLKRVIGQHTKRHKQYSLTK